MPLINFVKMLSLKTKTETTAFPTIGKKLPKQEPTECMHKYGQRSSFDAGLPTKDETSKTILRNL